jgi:hypothetical protein
VTLYSNSTRAPTFENLWQGGDGVQGVTVTGSVVKVGGVGPELSVEQKAVVLACAISIGLFFL